MIDLTLIQCPACTGIIKVVDLSTAVCQNCNHEFPIIEGIPILKLDASSDSALDLEQYEADHPVNLENKRLMYLAYSNTMQKYSITSGSCLEIGSGTGNLTIQLLEHSGFTINCSDISLRFLSKLHSVVGRHPKLNYWIFDASALPFRSDSMDAVFGHSVLHHLLNYEAALTDIFRVMRPGGIGQFGEPTMDSHAMTSFFAGVIHAMEQKTGNVGWNDREMGVLRAIRNANPTTGVRMRDRRQELAAKEDKHVFAIADMIRLGRQIGFSEVEYVNAYDPPKIGADHQHSLSVQLSRYSVPLEKLEPYNFIFQEFSDTFGLAMGKSAPFNFGYFIFRK